MVLKSVGMSCAYCLTILVKQLMDLDVVLLDEVSMRICKGRTHHFSHPLKLCAYVLLAKVVRQLAANARRRCLGVHQWDLKHYRQHQAPECDGRRLLR